MKNLSYVVVLVTLIGGVGVSYWLSTQHSGVDDEVLIETPLSEVDEEDALVVSEATSTPDFARIGIPYATEDLTIILTDLIEDSRCPSDVTCIQAGTVRVRGLISTNVGSFERTFVLREPVVVAGRSLILKEVLPRAISTKTIPKADYEFYFTSKE